MSPTLMPAAFLAKELRVLGPVWLVAAASMAITIATGADLEWGMLAYLVGTVALGALSIGHEYAHHTLPVLLVQPVSRSQILASKLGLLLLLLVTLSTIGWLMLYDPAVGPGGHAAHVWAGLIVALTLPLGLLVAPCVTLLARNLTAGVILTLAVPLLLWLAGEFWRSLSLGFGTVATDFERPRLLLTWGIVATATVAALLVYPLFARAQVAGDGGGVSLPMRGSVSVSRRRSHPLAALARKELRLQSMPLAVAGLFALTWTALSLMDADRLIAAESFRGMAHLYLVMIAMLAGAQACAEERASGTHVFDLLHPVSPSTKWVVKAGHALTAALVLGLGLITLLDRAMPLMTPDAFTAYRDGYPEPGMFFPFYGLHLFSAGAQGSPYSVALAPPVPPSSVYVSVTLLLAVVSLYASSLCGAGLRAFLLALPLTYVLSWLQERAVWFGLSQWHASEDRADRAWRMGLLSEQPVSTFWTSEPVIHALATFATALFLCLCLALAHRNYRSLQQSPRRIAVQVVGLCAFAGVGSLVVMGTSWLWFWVRA